MPGTVVTFYSCTNVHLCKLCNNPIRKVPFYRGGNQRMGRCRGFPEVKLLINSRDLEVLRSAFNPNTANISL